MKTAIIDNSLCNAQFVNDVKPDDIDIYIKSLFKSGVSFVEMVTDSFLKLPPDCDHSKVILRITDDTDLLYVNAFDFAYVVLPVEMLDKVDEITVPIICEVCLHGTDTMSVLKMFFDNFDFSHISVLRLVDDFPGDMHSMNELLESLRKTYIQAIDICPTNNNVSAVSACLAAMLGQSDCITMCYGNTDTFAELVDYTKCICTTFCMIPTPEVMLSLFSCDVMYRRIYGKRPQSFNMSLADKSRSPLPIRGFNADDFFHQDRNNPPCYIPQGSLRTTPEHISLMYKQLRSMQITHEEAKELEEVFNSFIPPLYKS